MSSPDQKAIYELDILNLVSPIPMEYEHLYAAYHKCCQESGSDKFWSLYAVTTAATLQGRSPFAVFGNQDLEPQSAIKVILRWGKIGLLGQAEVKDFDTKWAAKQYIDQRIKDKDKKAYRDVDPVRALSFRPAKHQVPVSPARTSKLNVSKHSFEWDL